MSRAGAVAVVAIALAAGLALRGSRLGARPMHHDEANQAVKFGILLESGEYRYDAHDHHGPTLYYLSLPAAWLRGQHTLTALDERTVRGVTVAFGLATILLLPLFSTGLGRTAVAASALLMAVSPAMVSYSRMYIQEPLFACFTLAFVIAVGRVATGGGPGWLALAGTAAGLAVATKETSVIVLPAALGAAAAAWWSLGPGRPALPLSDRRWRQAALASLVLAAAIAALFFTSFFSHPPGALEPFRSLATYAGRGMDPASHRHPWHYYLGLLAWSSSGGLRLSEGVVLVLAAAGAVAAWAPSRPGAGRQTVARWHEAHPDATFWARYLTLYAALTTLAFSAVPYKTPWNLLPFYVGLLVLAGVGFSALVRSSASRLGRAVLWAGLLLACSHLGWQAWRAAVVYGADPRNPYAYVHTVPDAVRMAARIRELAALHPDGAHMPVSVVAPTYEQWPLPWYLRSMPQVGYWTAPEEALRLRAPVVVSSIDNTAALDAALDDRYVATLHGLRPEVFLTLYVERTLWERALAGAP
jgi:uncharacterized protein (TIGR03663 family)